METLIQREAKHEPASREDAMALYRWMLVVREFETTVLAWCQKQIVPGISQLCIGQEASVVGTIFPLRRDDKILITYRGHGQSIVKGTALVPLFAEILGRAGGCCKGKGGPMHLTDVAVGNLGENPIVGAHLPIACGVAYALKKRGTDLVCLCDFSEGAVQIGTFHEAMNLAAIWALPVVFLCENNFYGVSTHVTDVMLNEHVAERAAAYRMPGVTVYGNDPIVVYDTVAQAVARARAGEGPSLVECITYRRGGHKRDDPATYRPTDEVEAWLQQDPLPAFRARLLDDARFDEAGVQAVEREVEALLAESVEFAQASPYAPAELAWQQVYA